MNWAENCAAVIPCRNEGVEIARVVREVRAFLPKVIVVDDGSSDLTNDEAVRAGAEVIRLEKNHGKGAALRAGWMRAKELGFAWAACLDGDGQHFPSDLTGLFAVAEQEKSDLVIGDRMQHPESIPWFRRQVNQWMSRRLSKLAGRDLPDTQSGLRLMRLEAWDGLPIRAEGFEVESDVLLAFIRAGHKVSFAPVGVRYGQEQSKIRPVYDTVRWFRWWMQVRR